MSDVAPRSGELPPEHRRRWLIRTLVAVVVSVALIAGGPWLYAEVIAPEAREPFTLSTPTAAPGDAAPADDAPQPIDVNGTWQIGAGSEAGYRLSEVLSGQAVTVTGRTQQVTGTMVVDDGALIEAELVVDAGSIATDESARDAYFRRALDTSTYPVATFLLSEPVDVAEVGTADDPITVTAPGTLTFHGISQAVTVDLEVQRTLVGVEVVGQIPIDLETYGLAAPDLGFVTVEPSGSIEILLVLTR